MKKKSLWGWSQQPMSHLLSFKVSWFFKKWWPGPASSNCYHWLSATNLLLLYSLFDPFHLFIFKNLFYWSIVYLQCVNFCCTAKWVIHIYAFSYSFPLWFLTGYWIQVPVLYSRTLLFIHPIHNSLHLLTPNSQSIPLSRWQAQACSPHI